MAYAATVTIKRFTVTGRRHFQVLITESEAGAATETALVDSAGTSADVQLPAVGRIAWVKATLTGGSGTTIDPRIGRASGWTASTQDDIHENGAAAAHIATEPNAPSTLGADADLYWQSVVDAGADNTTSIELMIVEGLAPV